MPCFECVEVIASIIREINLHQSPHSCCLVEIESINVARLIVDIRSLVTCCREFPKNEFHFQRSNLFTVEL